MLTYKIEAVPTGRRVATRLGRPRAFRAGDRQTVGARVRKVRWGVLGAARIALTKVIPATQQSAWAEVTAIASRDEAKARAAAESLGIPKAYGSYEALLADPEVDAVYNPLPNHLHLPWSVRAAEAGKHVLCEKPVGLNAGEAGELIAARDRCGVLIQEAFMVRTHPQWMRRWTWSAPGASAMCSIVGAFSFLPTDPSNAARWRVGRRRALDLGCYLVQTLAARREPARVVAAMEFDGTTGIDRLASMILTLRRPRRDWGPGPRHRHAACIRRTTSGCTCSARPGARDRDSVQRP